MITSFYQTKVEDFPQNDSFFILEHLIYPSELLEIKIVARKARRYGGTVNSCVSTSVQ